MRTAEEYAALAEEQLERARELVPTTAQGVARAWREHHEVASVTYATLALAAAYREEAE